MPRILYNNYDTHFHAIHTLFYSLPSGADYQYSV